LPFLERIETLMLEILSLRLRFCNVGPGDSVRNGVESSRRLSGAEGRLEPQSSQVRRAASFSNVHRGQATLEGLLDIVDGVSAVAGAAPVSLGLPLCLCDICVKAAFATCATEGLTPHARHGGIFVCTFAVAGSKLIGIGLEKPSIGHIQVAFELRAGAGVKDRTGLP
jgi:hypothetical protein